MSLGGPEHRILWGGAPLPAVQTLDPAIRERYLHRYYLPKLREDLHPESVCDRVTLAAKGLKQMQRPMDSGLASQRGVGRSLSTGTLQDLSRGSLRALSPGGHCQPATRLTTGRSSSRSSVASSSMRRTSSQPLQEFLAGPASSLGPVGRALVGQSYSGSSKSLGPPPPGGRPGDYQRLPQLIYGSRAW